MERRLVDKEWSVKGLEKKFDLVLIDARAQELVNGHEVQIQNLVLVKKIR